MLTIAKQTPARCYIARLLRLGMAHERAEIDHDFASMVPSVPIVTSQLSHVKRAPIYGNRTPLKRQTMGTVASKKKAT